MSLDPLLAEGFPISRHALAALVFGATQLVLPKGTPRHRAVGYFWAGLMLFNALRINKLNA